MAEVVSTGVSHMRDNSTVSVNIVLYIQLLSSDYNRLQVYNL